MIVNNPTDSALSIQFKGVTYSVKANSSLANVPAEVAEHWQSRVHNFVTLGEDSTPEVKAEVKTEVKKEVKEVKEEVVEKKATPKKK